MKEQPQESITVIDEVPGYRLEKIHREDGSVMIRFTQTGISRLEKHRFDDFGPDEKKGQDNG